ncbi:AmpG family muropeptide MFS transporter [Opitutus terrae]|nr:AmpG family muropeptide MFS transporter [Opitutus terrae]
MTPLRNQVRHALFWVPSLYLAMGIPFNVVNGTASTMFKALGVSDGQNTVALGSIIVAWSLKPLWAAFLDMYRTKKFFVLAMEALIAVLFVGVAMALPMPGFFKITIALLWVAAFASSTQDICGDGIYLTALSRKSQANSAGFQSMFWNLGKVLATGVLISGMEMLANAQQWSPVKMWMAVWITAAVAMGVFAVWHIWALPTGSIAHRPHSAREVVGDFLDTATTFFHKRAFWGMIAFVFLYRFGEGLLLVEGKLFMQSSTETGGLGLTAGQVANIDAVWGTIANIVGGVLGGLFLGKIGLKKALPILGLCLNVPHFTFVYLSHYGAAHHGLDYSTIATLVSIEKFGYGFGFVGNMVYMMQQLAPGRATMTHYAFATSLMNLMLVPTTMASGPLAEWLGFSTFFVVVMFASVPSVWAAWKAPFPLAADESREPAPDAHHVMITADDPTRLTALERTVQRIAGRASVYAMLGILVILLIDAKIVGSLQDRADGTGQVQFWLLLASAALKLFLAQRTFKFAAQTAAEAAQGGAGAAYVWNARGAKIATVVCLLVTAGVLYFTGRAVF